jgi:glutamate-ammonia-ligase adenylyltransferase
MPHLLEAVEFSDPARARREMSFLSANVAPIHLVQLDSLLSASPDPERALLYLVGLKQQNPAVFGRLLGTSSALDRLIAVFSHSRFLADEILKNPEWMESLEPLDRVLSVEHLVGLLRRFLKNRTGTPMALSLALFRRQQILRTLIRDVLGMAPLPEVTTDLSNIADAILQVGYEHVRSEVILRHGVPRYIDPSGRVCECGMAVIALGKLGGQELNYSSDIDLMFVYTASGETGGPQPISNKEFYKKLANEYTMLLSSYTPEGVCYRVDLRLRPDGSLGEVCLSLEGAQQYYQSRARDWELQMLIKARVAAGDLRIGQELLDFVEPKIYSSTLDFSAVESVSATRERISEKQSRRRGAKSAFDVKLARGGIRDIEFLVQCLQRLHGGRAPWIRHGGTLLSLSRLSDKDLLSAAEYGRLAAAYLFLRQLEHRLQFEDDRQTHTLPSDPFALDALARKMHSENLLRELNAHLEAVQEIYERVIHAQKPMYYTGRPAPVEPSNVMRFLDTKAPELAAEISSWPPPALGLEAFERFLENIVGEPEWLCLLNDRTDLARRALDVFEHSPYFSDELNRAPELVEILGEPQLSPEAIPSLRDPVDLRLFYRREMFRIQVASLCLREPVFDTLARTSDLADAAIAAAYRMAVDQVSGTHSPANPLYVPGDQMMVLALGRLGMREFDLGSDADLLFIVPDRDQSELVFWTRVANRLMDIISAYTGSGSLFAVDTRLRANGADGALVQCEGAYKDYFARHAEAWEGIAYMKARAVAGDVERATQFLNVLQELDWRRYGQSGRSKSDLRQMRMRLEREQGPGNPLKAGLGGFYDIDFAMLYLRLKSAGIFFKVLNMPERIDIVEKMGHLERAEADFLRNAVTFYRAVDHGLRIYSGHAEGSLPLAEGQLRTLTQIVRRWTPEALQHAPLPETLLEIQKGTRQIFDRLFS